MHYRMPHNTDILILNTGIRQYAGLSNAQKEDNAQLVVGSMALSRDSYTGLIVTTRVVLVTDDTYPLFTW